MAAMARTCVQSLLKFLCSITAMFGIAMILYAIWMLRAWQRHLPYPFPPPQSPFPWFIYTILGLGITLCAVTCSGHIAADTANGICLYLMFIVFVLMMLEAAVTTEVFFNYNWEKDFPEDPSGHFDEFKDFVRSNFEFCKWIGLTLVAVQGLSIILALILKALGPQQTFEDSDDDYSPARVPLLKNSVHRPPVVASDPVFGSKSNERKLWINEKSNR